MWNDEEMHVLETIAMRMDVEKALIWLRGKGFQMRHTKYHKIKSRIASMTDDRKFELMRKGLFELHLERIDQLETILKLSWENYIMERNNFRKQKILESIALLQPLLSKYYEASEMVITHDAKRLATESTISDPNRAEKQLSIFDT